MFNQGYQFIRRFKLLATKKVMSRSENFQSANFISTKIYNAKTFEKSEFCLMTIATFFLP